MEGKAGTARMLAPNKLRRELTLLPLAGLIYFTVCGGAFGIEGLVSYSGPGLALLMLVVMPLMFSIPNMLIVRELTSMMPAEGGYYHWVKKAFGPFIGFMAGWNNWIVSFLDVAIYPVWAFQYLQFFFPGLAEGPELLGISVNQILISGLIIWSISLLQIRGAKVAGWFTNGLGLLLSLPLFAMGFIGIWNWIASGTTISLPFLPMAQEVNVQNLTGAFSTGIFILLWNYIGWELPAAAGDEIINPKKTYPRAMALVLVLAVLSYTIPLFGSLYGGAGENDSYMAWGLEASDSETGLAGDLAEYGITAEKADSWGANFDSTSEFGWEFTNIAQVVGEKFGGAAFGLLFGALMTIAAVMSMVGLFTGNSLGGTRIPFALAEDGMFPKWMTKVHPKYGTPFVAIIFTGFVYWVFASFDFSTLVVADIFLQLIVIVFEFLSVWVLRFRMPKEKRTKVPGGWIGLFLVTLLPFTVVFVAIASQYIEEGFATIGIALALMAVGMVAYFPIRKWIKPGMPDVDAFKGDPAEL